MKNNLFFFILFLFVTEIRAQFEIVPNLVHTNIINSLAVTSDGKRVLTASDDKTLKIWDLSSKRCFKTLHGHKNPVIKVLITPDNLSVISIDKESWIMWDIVTGKLKQQSKAENKIEDIDISPDGKKVCIVELFKVTILDIDTGRIIKEYNNLSYDRQVLKKGVFSPDGNKVALVVYKTFDPSFGEKIIILDINLQEALKSKTLIEERKDQVSSLIWDKTGKYLISASALNSADGFDNETITIWDVDASKAIKNWRGFHNLIENFSLAKEQNLLAFSLYNDLKVWDISNEKEIFSYNTDNKYSISSVNFINNGKDILVSEQYATVRIVNIKNRQVSEALRIGGSYWENNEILSFSLSEEHNRIACNKKSSIEIWNLATAGMEKSLNGIQSISGKTDDDILISADNKSIFFTGANISDSTYTLYDWDIASNRSNKSFNGHKDFIRSIALSPDGSTLYSCGFENSFRVWDVRTGRMKKKVDIPILDTEVSIGILALSPNGKLLATGGGQPGFIWDTDNFTLLSEPKTPDATRYWYDKTMIFCGNEVLAVNSMLPGIDLYNVTNGKFIREIEKQSEISTLGSSKSGKLLIVGYKDNSIDVLDTETGNLVRTFNPHFGRITKVALSSDEKYLYSSSADGFMKIYSFPDCREIAALTANNDEWLIITPDGYFDCSTHGGELVSVINGNEIFAIDQFAVTKNRPDILLERLGIDNKELIQHHKNQYAKRLRKLEINETQSYAQVNYPSARIIDAVKKGGNLELNFEFADSRFQLIRYNIYMNDVPIYGSIGKKLNEKMINLSETIPLQYGNNKIEISCTNAEGIESPRISYMVKNEIKNNPDLYLIAFGVSLYENQNYNLKYAAKDAIDLLKVIESYKGKGFENVYTKVLTNEQVTPDAIKASKDFVKNAKPDDTFILFIAGHGMHDNDAEATYYYLTSNADINNLKGTAADFETIEDLLQGIPPRNKLFLMDACESGEIDDETYENLSDFQNLKGLGIASRGFKTTPSPSTVNTKPSTKRSYLYQKDRYIYNDLVRRSGAIVFSSSKGGELSYERSDIENGLFTEYIMKALTTTEADKDGNGFVSTDELREYVSAQVAKASGDLQHPTVDRDNIYQKFGFYIK